MAIALVGATEILPGVGQPVVLEAVDLQLLLFSHEFSPSERADSVLGSFFFAGGRSVQNALEHLGGHADRFAERRMRMDRLADVHRVRAHLDRQARPR